VFVKFKSFISENNLFNENDKILLAVSGGIDSAVMADLFVQGGYDCGIAHCNFKLRGAESDKDEEFVAELAEKYNLPFFTTSFDTENYAKSNNLSIQMAARELRYHWFEHIRQQNSFDYIAIGHNSNDVVETFIMNLARGTGIKGLTGISPKNDNIVRPLLFASRNDIKQYSIENTVLFREDSSNYIVKYTRNKIRHNLLPIFQEINPNFNNTIIENIRRLKNVERIYYNDIEQKTRIVISRKNNITYLNIAELQKLEEYKNYLYEFLQPYNFTNLILNDIESSLNKISGKVFYSSTHKLVKDRKYLIITKISEHNINKYYIDEDTDYISKPIEMSINSFNKDDSFLIPNSQDTACFDYEKIQFPLIIRKWEKGDYFMPLGMSQLKKVSDFLVDNKLSIIDKENLWLLLSGNKIIWIIGKRIDERFKITGNTRQVIEFKLYLTTNS
jgi:tRNA(Ile)-lysidine synthase